MCSVQDCLKIPTEGHGIRPYALLHEAIQLSHPGNSLQRPFAARRFKLSQGLVDFRRNLGMVLGMS